jgi:uncharacterized cupredoxin-like copper-binding protein
MSFARRVLIGALIIQVVGLVREVFFGSGLQQYLDGVVTLSDPPLALHAVVLVGSAALLVPVWLNSRWAALATVPLMLLMLLGGLPSALPTVGAPTMAEFTAWLTMTVLLVAAGVGVAFGMAASLEAFGRKTPAPALLGDHFSIAAMGASAALGSTIGMALLGVAVAATPPPADSTATLQGRPDNYVTVVMHNVRFDPADLELPAGKVTAVFLVNEDPFGHSFDVDELNVHVPVAAGETRVVMLDPPAGASLRFYCSIPGHEDAGMVGTLVPR